MFSNDLPSCLCNRKANGFFVSVATISRNYGITPGTPYEIRFSPTNNTYMFMVGIVTTVGTYTWTPVTNFLESSGGLPDTMVAELTLTPRHAATPISGEVRASTYTESTFISPLGVATFNLSDAT